MAPPTETEKTALKESLLGQLASTPFACTSLLELTNGTTNFVFRGQLEKPSDGDDRQVQTVIVKHTTGYAAANKDFAIDASRSAFEEAMLDALNNFQPSLTQSTINQQPFSAQAPRLLWFDRATNTQVLQDFAGAVDLKTLLLESAAEADKQQQHPIQENAHSIGFALGQWLHSFHAWTLAPKQSALRETIASNEPMRKLKHQITYDALLRVVSQFDVAEDALAVLREVQASAARDFGSVPASTSNNWGIIHGDFWSGNVLVPSDLAEKRLFAVDWEFAQLGHRAYDLGQMVGDLLERDHFRGATAALDILAGFVSGYGLGLQDSDLFYRTVIHAGVHLICCMIRRAPTGPLPGSHEQVELAIKLGVNLVVRGWARDEEWFRTRSIFAGLL